MIKLRTQQIIIDMPRSISEPWMNLVVQRIDLSPDGSVELNVVDRWGTINKKLSDVALEVNSYFEVLPLNSGEITVFGLADGIKSVATKWIVEKYGGTIQPNGDVHLEE